MVPSSSSVTSQERVRRDCGQAPARPGQSTRLSDLFLAASVIKYSNQFASISSRPMNSGSFVKCEFIEACLGRQNAVEREIRHSLAARQLGACTASSAGASQLGDWARSKPVLDVRKLSYPPHEVGDLGGGRQATRKY